MTTSNMKIVGEWDGEVIWRPKTAEEKVLEVIAEDKAEAQGDFQDRNN